MIQVTDWMVGQLRLTAFRGANPDVSFSEWAALTGTDPETRSAKPREATVDEDGAAIALAET